jgi:hypothetical protein
MSTRVLSIAMVASVDYSASILHFCGPGGKAARQLPERGGFMVYFHAAAANALPPGGYAGKI